MKAIDGPLKGKDYSAVETDILTSIVDYYSKWEIFDAGPGLVDILEVTYNKTQKGWKFINEKSVLPENTDDELSKWIEV